jgi:hypothetical protein
VVQVVFEEDEEEDLVPFPEEMLTEAPVEAEGEHHYVTEAAPQELIAAYMESDSEDDDNQGDNEEGGEEGSDGGNSGADGEGEAGGPEGTEGNPKS